MSRSSGRLVGRTVVITGGSAGIGAAAARAFAAAGANLVLVARGPEALARMADELAPVTEVMTAPLDVADLTAAAAMLERARERFGAIHVLVNNAAANNRGPVEEVAAEQLATIVDINLRAPIALTRMALPYLRAPGRGAVVNVASIAGMTPVAGGAVYSATKFGLRAFSFALAEELRGSGITVSVVSPGPVETGFIMDDIDSVSDVVFSQPMSAPEEVAQDIVDCVLDGKRERARPAATGYLATLGYLLPGLSRRLQPFLRRRGQAAKARFRAKYPRR